MRRRGAAGGDIPGLAVCVIEYTVTSQDGSQTSETFTLVTNAPDPALLCCYQAIRTLISHAADDAGLDSARISFPRARDGIRSRISDSGCFPPDGLAQSTEDLAFEITFRRNLVPERPGRRDERKTKRPGAGTRPASPARPPGSTR